MKKQKQETPFIPWNLAKKTLTVGALALTLGGASMPAVTVLADSGDATNLKDKQSEASKQATDSQGQAGKSTGGLLVDVNSDKLAKVIKRAEVLGIKVEKQKDEDHGTRKGSKATDQALKEIAENYDKQVSTITVTLDNYEKALNDWKEADRIYKDGRTVIKTKETAINKAVESAKAVGVQVTQTDNVTGKTIEEIKAGLDKQLQLIVKAQNDQEKLIKDYDAEVKRIEKLNTDATDQYNKTLELFNKEKSSKKALEDSLHATVEKAKKAGVVVEELPSVTGKTFTEAKEDMTKQLAVIQEAINKKVKADEEYAKKLAEVTNTNAKNQAAYEKEKAEKDAENKAIDKRNADKKSKFEKDTEKYKQDKLVAEQNTKKDGYLSEITSQSLAYESEPNANLKITGGVPVKASAIQNYLNKQYEAGENGLNNLNIAHDMWKGTTTSSPEWFTPEKATNAGDRTPISMINVKEGQTLSINATGLQNTSYGDTKIPRAEITYHFDSIPTKDKEAQVVVYKNPTYGIFLSSRDGRTDPALQKKLNVNYSIKYFDESNNPVKITSDDPALVTVNSLNGYPTRKEYVSNIGNARFIKITGSSIDLNTMGSFGKGVYTKQNSNNRISEGSRFEVDDWDRANSSINWYGGGVLEYKNTDTISYSFGTAPISMYGEKEAGWGGQIWFSPGSKVNISSLPIKPTPPKYEVKKELPKEPTKIPNPAKPADVKVQTKDFTDPKAPVKPTPLAKPKKPENIKVNYNFYDYPGAPKEPTKPNVKYYMNKLATLPTISKEVKNADGVNIDKQTIVKGSKINYPLSVEAISAGREEIKKVVITDALPAGFKLDQESTKKASKDWEIKYDAKTYVLSFTASKKILDQVNADRTKSVKLPSPVVHGTVENDNAVYKNNAHLNINDKVSSYSKIVEVKTPENPKPTKFNKDKDGKDINGQDLKVGDTNYYEIHASYENYKDTKVTADQLKEPFYIIDVPDASAVTFNVKDVSYETIDNKAISNSELTTTLYESYDKAPKEVQVVMDKAGVKPDKQFIVSKSNNTKDYFDKYVSKGIGVNVKLPMTINKGYSGTYTNMAYQVDFGNGYEANEVKNRVAKEVSKPKELPSTGSYIVEQTKRHVGVAVALALAVAGAVTYFVVGRKKEEK